MSGEPEHQPVLVDEALDGLAVAAAGSYVDATYGRGGHSAKILERLGGQGRLLALDKDRQAVASGLRRFGADPRFTIVHCGFEDFEAVVRPWLGPGPLSGALFDLGVSSPQLDEGARGFSFTKEGPLDMRMDTSRGPTAAEWLASVDVDELADVLRRYGEEPKARRIAAAIVRARERSPIETTTQLADVVAAAARGGKQRQRIHPATRVFQAIRIAVNRELESIEKGLAECVEMLAPGGRVAVISFHSLEDRIVKRFFAREARGDPRYAGLPTMPAEARPRLRLVGRLVRPSAAEVARNPRARSARLRVAEKLAPGAAA
ncbi:MAG TPA: 16S rRNA (cytosine(1402)-N(4))-methyltransferase RsmH [Gammaproteobacteria bacterium]|nr:16S rRNA (cytosine(1402)-N(4))-methyltransferase RsmH [Gammaproteobacteria bacterium]